MKVLWRFDGYLANWTKISIFKGVVNSAPELRRALELQLNSPSPN